MRRLQSARQLLNAENCWGCVRATQEHLSARFNCRVRNSQLFSLWFRSFRQNRKPVAIWPRMFFDVAPTWVLSANFKGLDAQDMRMQPLRCVGCAVCISAQQQSKLKQLGKKWGAGANCAQQVSRSVDFKEVLFDSRCFLKFCYLLLVNFREETRKILNFNYN